MAVYTDEKGYLRDAYGKLVHREIAFQKFIKNRHKYPLDFGDYQIHHKDGDKKNNKLPNLDILTREEHKQMHELGIRSKKELDDYFKKKEREKKIKANNLKKALVKEAKAKVVKKEKKPKMRQVSEEMSFNPDGTVNLPEPKSFTEEEFQEYERKNFESPIEDEEEDEEEDDEEYEEEYAPQTTNELSNLEYAMVVVILLAFVYFLASVVVTFIITSPTAFLIIVNVALIITLAVLFNKRRR